jgi:hypothetical protein
MRDQLDRLLAAPGAGPLCALAAWQWTPWIVVISLTFSRQK